MSFQLLQLGKESFAFCLDSAALSIADDLDIRVRLIMDRWKPTAIQTFMSKREGGNEWQFRTQQSSGRLEFVWWVSSSAEIEVASADVPFADRTTGWVRVRRSGTSVTFYTSTTDTNDHTAVSWTQLGAVQTTAAGSIDNTATHVMIGSLGSTGGEQLDGYVYAAAIVDDATTVADPIFADTSQGWAVGDYDVGGSGGAGDTADDGQGNTWELGGNAEIIGDNLQGASVRLQIGQGYDPFLAEIIWTDISSDLLEANPKRGRQHELDRINAGSMGATLKNLNGDYSAHNTAGPYYPNIKPTVPIRLRAVYDGTVYGIWQGFVDSWANSFPGPDAVIANLECSDLFKLLSLATAALPNRETAVEALSPVAWWRFSGSTATEDSSVAGTHTLTYAGTPTKEQVGAWSGDEAVLFDGTDDAATVANETDVERQGLDRSWEFWFSSADTDGRLLNITGAGGTSLIVGLISGDLFVATGGGAATVVVPWSSVGFHHVVVSDDVTGSTIARNVYLDGLLVASDSRTEPTGTFAVTIGGVAGAFLAATVSEVAVYPTALSAIEVAGLYAASYEAFATQRTDERIAFLLDNSSVLGGGGYSFQNLEQGATTMSGINSPTSGSLLDQIGNAVTTENGVFFMSGDGYATFHDRHYRAVSQSVSGATFNGTGSGGIKFSALTTDDDDAQLWNQVIVTTPGGDFIGADLDSQEAHGRRTKSLTTYPDDSNEGYDFAAGLASRYGSVTTRVKRVEFKLGDNAAAFPVLLAAEIGNRYTLVKQSPGDDISIDVYLESIEHRISSQKTWSVIFELSPAIDQALWILDDAELSLLDATTILGW